MLHNEIHHKQTCVPAKLMSSKKLINVRRLREPAFDEPDVRLNLIFTSTDFRAQVNQSFPVVCNRFILLFVCNKLKL